MKIGLKLYSNDVHLIPDALRLRAQGLFNYVELYIIPDSYKKTIDAWKEFNVPFIIHASHSHHGINLARSEMWETNKQHFKEVQQFTYLLGAEVIIAHGGNNGSFDETLRQVKLLNDNRIFLENKPRLGINDEICVGWSPAEFNRAADAGVLNGLVLDFGHAVCAANSAGIDTMKMIREFMVFDPGIFHLSDGNADSEKDMHLNFGRGNFNMKEFISLVPPEGSLTIETPRDPSRGLKDFAKDVDFLNTHLVETK